MEVLVDYLMQAISSLAAYTGSYGAAIISLAVIFRLLLLPLTALQTRWNQRYGVILPLLQEIARQSPTNNAARQGAVDYVYRQAGISRGAGIFLALALTFISVAVWYAVYLAIPHLPALQTAYLWMPSLALPNGWSLPYSDSAYYVTPALLLILAYIHTRIPLGRGVGWNSWVLAVLALFVPSALGLFWLAVSMFDLLVSFMVPHGGFWFSLLVAALAAGAGYAWSGSPYIALVLGWYAFTLLLPRLLSILRGPHKEAQTALWVLPHLVLGPVFLWLALQQQASLAALIPLEWTASLAWLPPITPDALAFLAAATALWLSELLLEGLARWIMPAFSLRARIGRAQARGQSAKADQLAAQLQTLYDKRMTRRLDGVAAQGRRRPKRALLRVAALIEQLEAQAFSTSRDSLLGRAYALQGAFQQALGNDRSAVASYLDAWRFGKQEVAASLAPLLAAAATDYDEALAVYIKYLTMQLDQPDLAQTEAVLKALQAPCRIAEGMAAEEVARRIDRLTLVLAAAPATAWAHYEQGVGLALQSKWPQARAALENARRLDPKHPATHLLLAKVYLHEGQRDLAEGVLEDLLRLNTGQAEAYYLLGLIKLDRLLRQPYLARDGVFVAHGQLRSRADEEQADEAARRLEQTVALDGSKGEYHYHLGLAHWVRARFDKAQSAFQRAAACGDRSKECQYYLAAALLASAPEGHPKRQEHRAAARTALQRALAADPNFAAANQLFADLLVEEGDYKQAAAHYRQVSARGKPDPAARLGLGRCLFELGEYQSAIEELLPIAAQLAPAHYWKARAQLKLARYPEALESLESYHTRASGSAESLYYLGCAYAGAGTAGTLDSRRAAAYLDEALKTLARCLSLQADFWPAHLQSGHIHCYRNDIIQARRCYLQANVYQPQNVAVLHALGKAALLEGSTAQARSYFERALQLEPGRKGVLLALGLLAERTGDLPAAHKAYTEARAFTNLGVLYCKKGDYVQAHRFLSATSAESGAESGAEGGAAEELRLYYLGYACAQTGRYADALRAWGDLSKRHPNDANLAQGITRLYSLAGAGHAADARYAEAAEAWEEYLRRCPGDKAAAAQLAQVYLALAGFTDGQKPGADKAAVRNTLPALQRAVSLTDGDSRYVYALALAELSGGDFEASALHLRQLLAAAPGDARYGYHLALALAGQGQAGAADALLQQVAASSEQPALAQMAPLVKVAVHAQAQEWSQAAALIQSWIAVRRSSRAAQGQ